MSTDVLAHGILIVSFIIAGLGTVLPGVPGSMLVSLCIVLHKWLLPEFFGWSTVSFVVAFGLLSWLMDFLSGVWGAKLGGATKAVVIGAAIVGFLGIFIGLPGEALK